MQNLCSAIPRNVIIACFCFIVDRPKVKAAKRMLEPEFYDNLKTRKLMEQEMKELLRNMVVYFVYVSIVFVICYGNSDPNAYREKLALQKVMEILDLNFRGQ